ncbi:hypothetical protein CCHL11_05718 [Colletotrichum chlorophyti]|uniref:Ribosome assembly protein 3 n=1 Tax=Colletotrichum chlorophyti TaxID=708187 RepID=A0A1Q8RTK4_9PEZI|nr:hypothetical protein CCHL11_05718 [Colletotrichum chlorophyti]
MSAVDFSSFYLQRTTQEFAEDLDKVRAADDFKADSVPFLVHALQQGSALYSPADQARVMNSPSVPVVPAAVEGVDEDADVDMDAGNREEPGSAKKDKSRKKDKKKKTSG